MAWGVEEQEIRSYISTMPELQRNYVRSPTGKQQREYSRCKQHRLELMRVWQMGAMERIVRRQSDLNDQRKSGKIVARRNRKSQEWSYKSSRRAAGASGAAVARSLASGHGWLQELASRVSTTSTEEERVVRFEGTPPPASPDRTDVYYDDDGVRVSERRIVKTSGRKARADTEYEIRLATDRETTRVVRSGDSLSREEAEAEAAFIKENHEFSKEHRAREKDLKMFIRSNERTDAVRWYETVTGGLVDTAGYDINGKEVDGWGRSLARDSGLVQELYRRITKDPYVGDYKVEYTDLPSPVFLAPGARKPSYQHQIVEKSPSSFPSGSSSSSWGSNRQSTQSSSSSGRGSSGASRSSAGSQGSAATRGRTPVCSESNDEVFKSPGRFPNQEHRDSCSKCGFPVGCNCEDDDDSDIDGSEFVLRGKLIGRDDSNSVTIAMVKAMVNHHKEIEATGGKPLGDNVSLDGTKEATRKNGDKPNAVAVETNKLSEDTNKNVTVEKNRNNDQEGGNIHAEDMDIDNDKKSSDAAEDKPAAQQHLDDDILDVDDDGEGNVEAAKVDNVGDEGFDEIKCAYILLNTAPPHGKQDVVVAEGSPCPRCPADCVGNPCSCNHFGMDAEGFTGQMHHGFEYTNTNAWLSIKCTHTGCEKQEPHYNAFRQTKEPVKYYEKDNIVREENKQFLSGVGGNWTCNQPGSAATAQNEDLQEAGEEKIVDISSEGDDDDMEVEIDQSETSELGEEGEEPDNIEEDGESTGDALDKEELGTGKKNDHGDKAEINDLEPARETEKGLIDEGTLESKTGDYLRTIGNTADWLNDYPEDRGDGRQSSCVRCKEPFIADKPEEQQDLARVGMHDAGLATWRASSCCHDIHRKCMQEWIFIRESIRKQFVCCPVCGQACTIVGVYTAAPELHPAKETSEI